jgi:SAM-dependent methyltransferase
MNADTPVCRTCRCGSVRKVGRLPNTWRFAGKPQPQALPGGHLYRCPQCALAFRHPLLGPNEYERLYREGASDLWDGESGQRRDFDLVRGYITGLSGEPDVLDIGCYTGQLLSSLPRQARLYGVEPNAAAAARATARGIQIVAADFEHLGQLDRSFDIITACDVIEHVPDPLQFLKALRSRLKPGGSVLLTTGNCDAWLWRLLGSSYWYCYFPEHISFIGTRWLSLMPPEAGLRKVRSVAFGNGFRLTSAASLRSLVGACLYACAPEHYRRLRGGRTNSDPPPGSAATRDHVFCALTAA